MVDWMVIHYWMMVMVVIVTGIVVGISVRHRFVLRDVQPRHLLTIQNLQILKALGARSASPKQVQSSPQGSQGHSRTGMWQDTTHLGTRPVASFRVKNMNISQPCLSIPSSKDEYFSGFFQNTA